MLARWGVVKVYGWGVQHLNFNIEYDIQGEGRRVAKCRQINAIWRRSNPLCIGYCMRWSGLVWSGVVLLCHKTVLQLFINVLKPRSEELEHFENSPTTQPKSSTPLPPTQAPRPTHTHSLPLTPSPPAKCLIKCEMRLGFGPESELARFLDLPEQLSTCRGHKFRCATFSSCTFEMQVVHPAWCHTQFGQPGPLRHSKTKGPSN